MAEINKMKE